MGLGPTPKTFTYTRLYYIFTRSADEKRFFIQVPAVEEVHRACVPSFNTFVSFCPVALPQSAVRRRISPCHANPEIRGPFLRRELHAKHRHRARTGKEGWGHTDPVSGATARADDEDLKEGHPPAQRSCQPSWSAWLGWGRRLVHGSFTAHLLSS